MIAPRQTFTVPLRAGSLELGVRTAVMGVINVTPDSFSDGGLRFDPAAAIDAALEMDEAGIDIIDIGGESTRPGAAAVPAREERERVVPVVKALAGRTRALLSVDTSKAEVAAATLDEGAHIINDISGLRYDPALAGVVASRRAALVLMHMRGRPETMYREARYGALMLEIASELRRQLMVAIGEGVPKEAIILDPGIGFAKKAEHSLAVLAQLGGPALGGLDRPLLVGPSRKSFLQGATGPVPAAERDWATAAAVTAAVLAGAHIVRVHAVREMLQVVRAADMIRAHRTSFGG